MRTTDSMAQPRAMFALVALACGAAAHAATIEITPDDDYRTAMQSLVAGDTLVMHGGTYALSSYFELDLVGTAQAPVTIRAAAGEQPVVHYVDAGQNIVNIANSAFLVIDGIEFSGGSRGLRLINSSDITIRNCHVHDTAANAISANDGGNVYARLVFVHNEIDHAGDTAEGFYLGCTDDACRVHDSLVANNYIHDLTGPTVSQGDGIEIKAGSYANVVRDNVIHDTAYPGITLYHVNGNGAPNIIERNLVWNSGHPIVTHCFPPTDVYDAPAVKMSEWQAWQGQGWDKNSLVADPQFENITKDDYRLKPGSPAIRQLGFQPLPIDEMGLIQDKWRTP